MFRLECGSIHILLYHVTIFLAIFKGILKWAFFSLGVTDCLYFVCIKLALSARCMVADMIGKKHTQKRRKILCIQTSSVKREISEMYAETSKHYYIARSLGNYTIKSDIRLPSSYYFKSWQLLKDGGGRGGS